MNKQDNIFWSGEGDAWFQRNRDKIGTAAGVESDYPLSLIRQYNLRPQRVLEVGCSNGWRLDAIQREYRSLCVGVEPSEEAIADGQTKFPLVDFRRGLASSIPCSNEELFDLLVVNFVLHWVDRVTLIRSIAEIDRLVVDGGYMILTDFLPDFPQRTRYHHRQDVDLRTYKLDYGAVFETTALYTSVARVTFHHDSDCRTGKISSYDRAVCQLLRKSTTEFCFE